MSTANSQAAEIKNRKSISSIWLIPLITLMIGLWLLYRAMADAGIVVTLHMPDGDGITPGKTQVIYKGLPAGKVKTIQINSSLDGVVVEVELKRDLKPLLTKETEFWVVRPQISAASISGLETLLSGNYITFREGRSPGNSSAQPHLEYSTLATPPPLDFAAPGLHITLMSDALGSLERGSPIYYKQINVGSVQDYKFTHDGQQVRIDLHIKPDYQHMINTGTRFWNAGGLTIEGSLSGIKVHTESLTSLLAGGITFSTTTDDSHSPVSNGHQFELFENFEEAKTGELITIDFPTGSSIIPNQTKVLFEGIEVGIVKGGSINDEFDTITTEVLMDPRAKSALVDSTQFWLVKPKVSLSGISGLDALLQGNYITLKVGDRDNSAPKRHFIAIDSPPPLDMDAAGLNLYLTTQELGSLSIGSPILYRQIEVGSVQDYQLSDDGRKLKVQINILPQYTHLVNSSTRFWNASGVTIQGSIRGKLSVHTESLSSIINGGIAFTTPNPKGQAIKNRHTFALFDDQESAHDTGIPIQIYFNNGHGLSVGAPIRYRGIDIGEVTSVGLQRDLKGVFVQAQLDQSAAALAREHSQFWIVLPELGLTRSENLDTLLGGPYLTLKPGGGASRREFNGLARAPSSRGTERGIEITLLAPQRGSLQRGSTVYYRQVPVGKVLGVRLADSAQQVEINTLIYPRYRNLIRSNTRFWNASGIDIDVGLFKGAKVRTESVESIISGGIALAIPEEPGVKVKPGTRFYLNEEPHPNWEGWSPEIELPAAQ